MSEAPMPPMGEGKTPENGCLKQAQKRNCSENGTVTSKGGGLLSAGLVLDFQHMPPAAPTWRNWP